MGRYVAFLRGINVGGRTRIAMGELREVLAELGYAEISTLLNSGNAIFTAAARESAAIVAGLERAIEERFARGVRCLVRTGDELGEIVARDPFAGVATDGARYMVTFLSGEPDPVRVAAIDPEQYLPEEFAVVGREVYLWCPEGLAETAFTNVFFEKRLGVVATARNWNTVGKVLAVARR